MQLRISLLALAALLCSAPALGGLYEDLYRGLGYLATPSGSPIFPAAGGGMSNGSRYGRLRIVPNEFGEGHRLEFDRNFGADGRGRPEVFDIGNLELQLTGSTASTIQYTGRGVQTLNVDVFANNVGYVLTDKTGVQDFELRGTVGVNHQLEINRLGFYYLDLEISNTGAGLNADGVIIDGPTDTDFDIGPINIRGNVFVDAAAAALNAFGVDTSGLEGLFPESPIARINDEIEAYINQYVVLGEAFTADLADGTLSSECAAVARDFIGGLVATVDEAATYESPPFGVPESSTLLLIGALVLIGMRRRM
ncbi:MAG: hypothetical protein KKI02_02600 [Planctomycetes bacterium]|nr:hypothetical protein [Planctomycetota bacterium]